MDLSLFFAGTGGSVPSAYRGLPAIVVRLGGEKLLFDCGEGTQRQLVRSIGLLDVECVFVTHFHADHWLGLPGMLKSFALREREQPLVVYGPRGLRELMGAMRIVYGRLPYELSVVELEPTETVRREGYAVAAVPVSHRASLAFGYAIVEDARPGHLDAQLAEQLGVKPGPDLGRLQRGETVDGVAPEQVMGPTREGRKIVLSGDTEPCEALAVAAHEADVLVHEATFTDEEAERARLTAHSTATQAATLARDAHVRLLALTHVSSRYGGGQLRDEARAVFAATEAPRDFDTIEVPFPERGGATLERWSERQARERAGGADGARRGGSGDAPAQEAGAEESERAAPPPETIATP
ncbi:MAG TPA: ribonuclease Z [Solirubrobacteraceae bacterium]|jgi:ribonuclease Z|nr:ribonuclease Z [Solirubrobacteraceae bacterium]